MLNTAVKGHLLIPIIEMHSHIHPMPTDHLIDDRLSCLSNTGCLNIFFQTQFCTNVKKVFEFKAQIHINE